VLLRAALVSLRATLFKGNKRATSFVSGTLLGLYLFAAPSILYLSSLASLAYLLATSFFRRRNLEDWIRAAKMMRSVMSVNLLMRACLPVYGEYFSLKVRHCRVFPVEGGCRTR
jgi:hypothetical protein